VPRSKFDIYYNVAMISRFITFLYLLALPLTLFGGCCGTFSGSIDYLLWRPCVDGLYSVIDEKKMGEEFTGIGYGRSIPIQVGEEKVRSKVHPIDTDSDSGVRLAFGFQPCNTCWDLQLKWLYFFPHSRGSTDTLTPSLIPFSSLPGLTLLVPFAQYVRRTELDANAVRLNYVRGFIPRGAKVRHSWDLEMHLVDVEWRYCLGLNCDWTFSPLASLRYAHIEQEFRIKTDGEVEGINQASRNFYYYSGYYNFRSTYTGATERLLNFKTEEHNHSCFDGIGPRLGFETEWVLGCGFSLFGRAAASSLYGEREVKARETIAFFDSLIEEQNGTGFPADRREDNKWCVRFLTDVALGLAWHHSFRCDSYTLVGRLGWEYHHLYRQSAVTVDEVTRQPFSHEDADVSMQGLTLSGGIRF